MYQSQRSLIHQQIIAVIVRFAQALFCDSFGRMFRTQALCSFDFLAETKIDGTIQSAKYS